MVDYKDPRVIALDIGSTFVVLSKFLRGEREPFTSEDCRAMAISAHIQADRNGYRGPVDERVVDSPDNGPEGEPIEEQGKPPKGPMPGEGFDYKSQSVPSEKQKEKIGYMIEAAIKVVMGVSGKTENAARKVVMSTISNAFSEQWGRDPNLTSFRGMRNGECSWTIDFIKMTW
jgi:hypothetical protein